MSEKPQKTLGLAPIRSQSRWGRSSLLLNQALFDRLAGCANDLGLLAEEIDTQRGELLGNFPQAFSHVGLINAAWDIDQARTAASQPEAIA
jgi:GH15 family glucan-1,4-alpha-glucosidase